MKAKLIIVVMAALLCGTSFGTSAFDIQWWNASTYSNSPANTLKQWAEGMEGRVGGFNPGTGKVWYVDSAVASPGDGTSWANAKSTLDAAVNLCTADRGDVIYVAQGHAEDWTTVDSVDVDVAGVTIIGCGQGLDRPTFTYDDTDPELVLGAPNCSVYNLNFLPSVTGVVHAIEIEADANNCTIDGCWFMNGETSGTDEFIDAIQPAALANNITVRNCLFESYGAAGANTAIDLTAGVNKNWKIIGNYFSGDYAEAPIYSDNDVHLRMLITNNVCYNTNSGEYGIEFGGAATGVIAYNTVYSDSLSTAIDPGSMSCIENYAINTTDLSAARIPANTLDAIITDLAGISQLGDKVVADMDANSTLVTGSNLDRLAKTATADTSDPVDIAEVVDNSVLAHILTDDGDTSDYDRRLSSLERISMWQQVQMAYGNATPGYAHPVAYWFVDPAIGASGDGKTPFTCFATIDEAITASSDSVEDFIIVWDYSGSAGTITINKSWIHLLGMVGSTHPYPRIAATTGHGITLSNGAGRIEIAGFTIGAQSTKAGIGLDTGSASQVYVHDCHFGIDASSACQEGIYVASGADAVDLVVEKCEFKTAITQQGIEIAGNATWGRIRDNLFIGCTASDAYPAIDISGSAVGIAIEENRIGGGADDGAGWGITLSAGSSECWINNNYANDAADAVTNNPFLEGGTANAWGMNYKDIRVTIPD